MAELFKRAMYRPHGIRVLNGSPAQDGYINNIGAINMGVVCKVSDPFPRPLFRYKLP